MMVLAMITTIPPQASSLNATHLPSMQHAPPKPVKFAPHCSVVV